MTVSTRAFAGFPRGGLDFLEGLARDNSRDYFDAHRDTYQAQLLQPAKDFVVALGEELRARVSPALRAEPRVNGSILRINRDTRFSADKRPYKEHLDFWFWEGEGASREHPGLAVRLRAGTVALGAGMVHFTPDMLAAYRAGVADDRLGPELEAAMRQATDVRRVGVGDPTYKRVPRGFPPDHPRADLLRRSALFAAGEWKLPREVTRGAFVGWAADRLAQIAPVERWLTAALDASS